MNLGSQEKGFRSDGGDWRVRVGNLENKGKGIGE